MWGERLGQRNDVNIGQHFVFSFLFFFLEGGCCQLCAVHLEYFVSFFLSFFFFFFSFFLVVIHYLCSFFFSVYPLLFFFLSFFFFFLGLSLPADTSTNELVESKTWSTYIHTSIQLG